MFLLSFVIPYLASAIEYITKPKISPVYNPIKTAPKDVVYRFKYNSVVIYIYYRLLPTKKSILILTLLQMLLLSEQKSIVIIQYYLALSLCGFLHCNILNIN